MKRKSEWKLRISNEDQIRWYYSNWSLSNENEVSSICRIEEISYSNDHIWSDLKPISKLVVTDYLVFQKWSKDFQGQKSLRNVAFLLLIVTVTRKLKWNFQRKFLQFRRKKNYRKCQSYSKRSERNNKTQNFHIFLGFPLEKTLLDKQKRVEVKVKTFLHFRSNFTH